MSGWDQEGDIEDLDRQLFPHSKKLGYVEGIRTNCWTGEKTEVQLRYDLKESEYSGIEYIYLKGGPTGYESAPISQLLHDLKNSTYCSECKGRGCPDGKCDERQVPFKGWSACAGTPNKWDELWISKESLLRELNDT